MILRALAYATKAHEGQVRKFTGEPYISHPIEVASILEDYKLNIEIVCAGLLHDVIEDCDVSFDDISKEFGYGVASIVRDVTKVPNLEDGNRAVRKQIDEDFYVNEGSYFSWLVKMADIISNVSDIVKQDPSFARLYLNEKNSLLARFDTEVKNLPFKDIPLLNAAHAAVAKAERDLDNLT